MYMLVLHAVMSDYDKLYTVIDELQAILSTFMAGYFFRYNAKFAKFKLHNNSTISAFYFLPCMTFDMVFDTCISCKKLLGIHAKTYCVIIPFA